MWELEKAILITNNDRVQKKYQEKMEVIYLNTYEDVLLKVRDYVHQNHKLLTHPQASSLKPNQTPYRSIVVYPKGQEDNGEDILLIERCIDTFRQWQDICKTPVDYKTKVAEDFKTIDLSVIDNIIPRIQ